MTINSVMPRAKNNINVVKYHKCTACNVHELAICAPLSGDFLRHFSQGLNNQNFNAGMVVFEEGEKCTHVYTLLSGTVRLLKSLDDGRRYITDFVIAGEFIGMIDDDKYILTAESITSITLCKIEVQHINACFNHEPLLKNHLLSMIRTTLHRCYNHQFLLSRLSPLEKVARFLYELQNRMKMQNLSVEPLKLDMNRKDIADHLGLTIETVSRCFSKLKAQSVIHLISANIVEIIDIEKLKTLAAFSKEVV